MKSYRPKKWELRLMLEEMGWEGNCTNSKKTRTTQQAKYLINNNSVNKPRNTKTIKIRCRRRMVAKFHPRAC